MLSAVFAENEREIIRERTNVGLQAARARGRIGGRPTGLSEKAKQKASMAAILYKGGKSISDIRTVLKIGSNSTIYRYLRHEGINTEGWNKSPIIERK